MPAKVQLVARNPLDIPADYVAVPVTLGGGVKGAPLAAIDRALGKSLAKVFAREDFRGQKDQQLEIPTYGRLRPRRLLFFGIGAAGELTHAELRAAAAKAARAANASKAGSLVLGVPEGVSGAKLRFLSEGLVLGEYRFSRYQTGERKPKATLGKLTLALGARAKITREDRAAAALGQRTAEAVCLTRDLVNEPPNELFPARLAAEAERMCKEAGLKCQVFDKKEIDRRGMKLLSAVGRGSANEPRFIHMTYVPEGGAKKKVAVIGKGLTFDSGGLCIKPAPGMGEMKTDMAGAANVIGLLAAAAACKPQVELHGIIASAENMPDGDAYRPGDVFGSLDGKTVEIINTDAEGRLVLADALAYARKLDPDVIVDNATLTGACVIALGKTCSGFYATSDEIADRFAGAARDAGEQFWRMPLLEDLKDQLKSDIADLKHTGDRWGGSITAALFLREFAGQGTWLHADIAGPVWADRAQGIYPKGATGHGVLTFLAFLERLS
jgi:leucyl aminopeptidase